MWTHPPRLERRQRKPTELFMQEAKFIRWGANAESSSRRSPECQGNELLHFPAVLIKPIRRQPDNQVYSYFNHHILHPIMQPLRDPLSANNVQHILCL